MIARAGFNAEIFPPRGEAEMQDGLRLNCRLERAELGCRFDTMDRQHGRVELNAKLAKPVSLAAERPHEPRRRVFTGSGKGPKASDEEF